VPCSVERPFGAIEPSNMENMLSTCKLSQSTIGSISPQTCNYAQEVKAACIAPLECIWPNYVEHAQGMRTFAKRPTSEFCRRISYKTHSDPLLYLLTPNLTLNNQTLYTTQFNPPNSLLITLYPTRSRCFLSQH